MLDSNKKEIQFNLNDDELRSDLKKLDERLSHLVAKQYLNLWVANSWLTINVNRSAKLFFNTKAPSQTSLDLDPQEKVRSARALVKRNVTLSTLGTWLNTEVSRIGKLFFRSKEDEVKALKEETIRLENEIVMRNCIINELKLFREALMLALEDFIANLKCYCNADVTPEQKLKYEDSYNALIDLLVKFEAFKKDEDLTISEKGVALWSKINQLYALALSKKRNMLTLEGSLAGHLFDNLKMGIQYTTDPENPMKQFWMRMSKEIAATAKGKALEVHVFEHVVKNSAFYTDEWPSIEKSIQQGEIKSLNLYIHTLESDQKYRDIYLLKSLPSVLDQYENSYLVTDKPRELYYVKNGKAQKLEIHNNEKLSQVCSTLTFNDQPITRDLSDPTRQQLQLIIRMNPGHSPFTWLRQLPKPIQITTTEQLERYVKDANPAYILNQKIWHETVMRRNIWEEKGKPLLLKSFRNGNLKKIVDNERSHAAIDDILQGDAMAPDAEIKSPASSVDDLSKSTIPKPSLPQITPDPAIKEKPKGFLSRHKWKIIVGALAVGLIVGGLFTLGTLSAVGIIAGTSILAGMAAGLGTTATAVGGSIAAHVGVASAVVATKAVIGSSVVTLGATVLGGTSAMVSSALADRNKHHDKNTTKPEQTSKMSIPNEKVGKQSVSNDKIISEGSLNPLAFLNTKHFSNEQSSANELQNNTDQEEGKKTQKQG